jgi:hypothetical protein
MKLTPEKRLLVYEELLKVVCKDPSVDKGMCSYLTSLLDGSKNMPKGWTSMFGGGKMKLLPELNKYNKYNNNYFFWAPLTKEGWETRISWIEQAIIDVKKKIK